jgi:hypothetical protein
VESCIQVIPINAISFSFCAQDAALEAKLRGTYESLASTETRGVPVTARVTGSLGSPLSVTLSDGEGREVSGKGLFHRGGGGPISRVC